MESNSIPMVYRVEGLAAFDAQEQVQLLTKAQETAKASFWTRCAVFTWVVLCLAIVYFLRHGHFLEVAIVGLVGVMGNIAILLLRVRSELRRLARVGIRLGGTRGAA